MIKIRRLRNGFDIFEERITTLSKKDIDLALKKAGKDIVDFVSVEVIASEGKAIGKKWRKLSPAYKKQKKKKYPGRGILEATGLLSKSFKSKTQSFRGVNRLTVFNIAPYFKYHQSSAPRKTNLPRRVTLKPHKNIIAIVQKHIRKLYA